MAKKKNAPEEEIVEDITKQYAGELGYSEDLIHDMLGGYSKDELIDIIEETVREMISAQYKENASDKIDEIQSQPSESELQTMKDMILGEMYKDGKGVNQDLEKALELYKQSYYNGNYDSGWIVRELEEELKKVRKEKI